MLDEVVFNFEKYKYRMESERKLLLYNPRTSRMLFVSGKTCKMMKDIIEGKGGKVNIEDKYISFFLKEEILKRRNT